MPMPGGVFSEFVALLVRHGIAQPLERQGMLPVGAFSFCDTYCVVMRSTVADAEHVKKFIPSFFSHADSVPAIGQHHAFGTD